MGAMQNNRSKKSKRSSKRREPAEKADWSEADANAIIHAIETITKTGGAIRFGYNRTGTAYGIGLYDDGDSWTEWCEGSGDPTKFLVGLASQFTAGDDL